MHDQRQVGGGGQALVGQVAGRLQRGGELVRDPASRRVGGRRLDGGLAHTSRASHLRAGRRPDEGGRRTRRARGTMSRCRPLPISSPSATTCALRRRLPLPRPRGRRARPAARRPPGFTELAETDCLGARARAPRTTSSATAAWSPSGWAAGRWPRPGCGSSARTPTRRPSRCGRTPTSARPGTGWSASSPTAAGCGTPGWTASSPSPAGWRCAAGRTTLVRLPGAPLRLPSLAIHLDRSVREGLTLDPQRHLVPVWDRDLGTEPGLAEALADAAGVDAGRRRRPRPGARRHPARRRAPAPTARWVAAPRLDNLGCCHSGLPALLAARGRRAHPGAGLQRPRGGRQRLDVRCARQLPRGRRRAAGRRDRSGGDPQAVPRAIARSVLVVGRHGARRAPDPLRPARARRTGRSSAADRC